MKAVKKSRIATLMVHSSPLDQAGMGDAGGMNVYVSETAKKMAQAGVGVDIFTRANHADLPESIEIADGVNVKHLIAGPFEGLSKEELPSQLGALTSSFMNYQKELPNDYYSLLHSHYWISGQLGWMVSERTGIPLIHTMHTTAKVKNLNLAEGETPEPHTRAIGEEQVVKAATGLIANTDADHVSWVEIDKIPNLAFDHNEIVQMGLQRLKNKLTYQPIGFDLLPQKFLFSQLENLYTTIIGKPIDRRNFRKKMLSFGFITETEEFANKKTGRPAKLYTFNISEYKLLEKEGIHFEIKLA